MPDANIYDQMIGNNVSESDVDAAVKKAIGSEHTPVRPADSEKASASGVFQQAVTQKNRDAEIAAYYKRRSQESSADAGKKPAESVHTQSVKSVQTADLPKTSAPDETKPAQPVQEHADEPVRSGRKSAEKEKIFNAATSRSDMPTDFRVRKDELKKKTTVRDVPKPVISYLTALFAGMGFYKASMKDMIAAFIVASVDPGVYDMLLPCLSDVQKAMAQEYMKRHKSMTDEFLDTKKKMDRLDKKLDTVRMMTGWLIADKCGYGPETYPSPKEIVLNQDSDRGMVSDVIVRADAQADDVRRLVSDTEGRPQSGK